MLTRCLARKVYLYGLASILFFLCVGLFLFFRHNTSATYPHPQTTESASVSWQTYHWAEYGISFRYPSSWELLVFETSEHPAVRVFAPETRSPEDGRYITSYAAQVSFFPKGAPPDMFRPNDDALYVLEQDVKLPSAQIRYFTQNDDVPFAIKIHPPYTPPQWGPSGFVWAQTSLQNVAVSCKNRARASSSQLCDLLFGDTPLYYLVPSEEEYQIITQIAHSLRWKQQVVGDAEIYTPKPNARLGNPATITGRVPNGWFFEDRFPVVVEDVHGIAIAHGEAVRDTQDASVEAGMSLFRARIRFLPPAKSAGAVVLMSANPSGLPENAEYIRIPIVFHQ